MRDYEVDIIELKKLMIENNIDSIECLSNKSGVNRNTLSEVLSGKSFPSSIVMQKLGRALRMTSAQMGSIFFKKKLA